MKKNIFRQVSIERLSSPEQLDELMQITTPKGWIAMIALASVLIAALFWGICGKIPTKVIGQGILIKPGGIFDIVALGSGQITELLIQSGDIVNKGQVVATIAQPVLVEEINQAETNLKELRAQHEDLIEFGTKDLQLQTEYLNQQRTNLLLSIEVAEKQLQWAEEKIKVQEDLFKQGLVTKQALLTARQTYYATKGEVENLRNQLRQISVNELSLKNQKQQEVLASQLRMNEAERKITRLKHELEMNSKVTSPYSGRILEIVANVGEVVRGGEPILKLDLIGQTDKEIEAILYIPPADGKKVRPGMEVQISPTTVKQEEFGFMIGRVTSVAGFPSTLQGMMRVLKNQQLINKLSGGGAPFEVYADLIVDSNTESGYKWSSSRGPTIKVYSGTLCTSAIVIREQRPISLVIPMLREKLGI